mmetsp:Transcript_123108/g.274940  ORF Transcript_123108/g.274940 Transcript_123108/m.274940 type:complete len:643 (-) Transcript_123108:276-2204(-)
MLDDDGESYKVFKLKNREFALDVDVSHAFCGMNGAMYFIEMDKRGGLGVGNNQAGAAYGTGYCDAQCPHDIKFVNGKANLEWQPNTKDFSGNMGLGHYGACCAEMDIWEANSMANAYTPHPCNLDTPGQYACEGVECGDNDAGERYKGVCDKDGCDINPYRNGNYTFYGRGPEFTINTLRPMTIVTQFLTNDGTDDGDLSEIRRFYIQDGKTIHSPPIKILPSSPDSITDESCAAMKDLFGNVDDFKAKGGNAEMGRSLDRGHVAAFSLWDDVDVSMMWLDSSYPRDVPSTDPGVKRGECPGGDDSTPEIVRRKYGSTGYVTFANAAVGEIGTTQSAVATTSLPETETATTTITSTFAPVDGGANRACRGANSNDNSNAYFVLHMGMPDLEDCKAKCVETEGCKGIEHNSNGRCEVWQRSGGIQASSPVSGFTCLRYGTSAIPAEHFEPVDSGVGRACRGANSHDNSNSYYVLHMGVTLLDDCKTKCAETDGCQGIEHNSNGRCEVWTRSEGIQASSPISGFTCLRYVTSTSSTHFTSTSTPSPTSTSTESSGECVQAWGQCGGVSYTGPVCCVGGHTCEFSSQWYSQCKPTSSLLEGGPSRQAPRAAKSRRHHFMGPALIQSSARVAQVPIAEAAELMQEL